MEKDEVIEATSVASEQQQPQTPPPADEPERRGRGRPRKEANKATTTKPKAEPAKKPTAPRPRSPKKNNEEPDIGALAKQIQGLHQFAAMATGLQELVISEQESGLLANGLVAVSNEYGLSVSGKTGAALQLLAAAAMVYTPRVGAIKAKVAHQRELAEHKKAADLQANFQTPIDPNPPKQPAEPNKTRPPEPDQGAMAAAAHAAHMFNQGLVQ